MFCVVLIHSCFGARTCHDLGDSESPGDVFYDLAQRISRNYESFTADTIADNIYFTDTYSITLWPGDFFNPISYIFLGTTCVFEHHVEKLVAQGHFQSTWRNVQRRNRDGIKTTSCFFDSCCSPVINADANEQVIKFALAHTSCRRSIITSLRRPWKRRVRSLAVCGIGHNNCRKLLCNLIVQTSLNNHLTWRYSFMKKKYVDKLLIGDLHRCRYRSSSSPAWIKSQHSRSFLTTVTQLGWSVQS